MSDNAKTHMTVSETMNLPFAAETIWPQLCPTREYDWIETWACELVHSESGYNEYGCVFRTDLPTEGDETWVTSRFEPHERIEFVRSNTDRVIHFVIELDPDGEGGTNVKWTHHVTALNAAGIDYIKEKPAAFKVQMSMLNTMLSHYLRTGEMLKGAGPGLTEKIGTHVHGRKTG